MDKGCTDFGKKDITCFGNNKGSICEQCRRIRIKDSGIVKKPSYEVFDKKTKSKSELSVLIKIEDSCVKKILSVMESIDENNARSLELANEMRNLLSDIDNYEISKK